MYEQVFNLSSRPFTSTPYVKHYFPAAAIDQSLQQCKLIIDRGAGPVVVIGDHGTGKTLLLAMLEENYKSQFRIVNLSVSVMRGRSDLLQSILFELQLDYRGLEESEMRLSLVEYLKSDEKCVAGILLLIDDGQKLSRETIEELQLLTNFIRSGQPLVRLVLAGSRGLEERLADSSLESFNQRIAGRCFLACLGGEEVESYVRAHLSRAGGNPDELFADDAYRAIREVSEGRPRYINQVCDHAMIFSATRGQVPVNDSLVREAWYDIQQLPGTVAPSGSGAAKSETPVFTQSHTVEDSEGWTVLEFGQLGDSDLKEFETESEAAPESTEAEPEAEQEVVEIVSSELPQPTEPRAIPGPSFSVTPQGQTRLDDATEESTEQQSIPVEVDNSNETADAGFEAATAAGGAAILASAMAGFSGTEDLMQSEQDQPSPPQSPQVEMASPPSETVEETFATSSAAEPATIQTNPVLPEPTPVASDPFADDSFENEEVLAGAYSPFVAQQNQRSLDVTTEQLQNLTPHDAVETQTPVTLDAVEIEEETFPTSDTAMLPPNPVRAQIKTPGVAREIQETRQEVGITRPSSDSDEFDVINNAASLDDANRHPSAESFVVEPAEANPGSGFVPLDPSATVIEVQLETVADINATIDSDTPVELDVSSLVTSEAEQPTPPAEVPTQPEVPHLIDTTPEAPLVLAAEEPQPIQSPIVQQIPQPVAVEPEQYAAPEPIVPQQVSPPMESAPVVEATVEAVQPIQPPGKTGFHEQAASPEDPEIRRQALEIIASLGTQDASDPVSHETTSAPETIQEETDAIHNTIQRSILAREAAAEKAKEQVAPIVMPDLEKIQQSLQQAQASQGHAPIPPVQPIPVQMANTDPIEPERRVLEEIEQQSAMLPSYEDNPATIQYAQQPPVEFKDDRDMLDVEPQENIPQLAAPPTAAAEPLPAWSQQEPSQGEAARVDYQKLFDQLRNIQGTQE